VVPWCILFAVLTATGSELLQPKKIDFRDEPGSRQP
jgi:hypothetical protein